MSNKDFGSYIKRLRQVRGLNITETAKLSGISQPYLSQVENGERAAPSYKIIQKLGKALDANYYDLLAKAGHMSEGEAQESKIKLIQAQQDFSNMQGFNLIDVVLDERPVFYNKHKLTPGDRQRVLNMLEVLFPQYEGDD